MKKIITVREMKVHLQILKKEYELYEIKLPDGNVIAHLFMRFERASEEDRYSLEADFQVLNVAFTRDDKGTYTKPIYGFHSSSAAPYQSIAKGFISWEGLKILILGSEHLTYKEIQKRDFEQFGSYKESDDTEYDNEPGRIEHTNSYHLAFILSEINRRFCEKQISVAKMKIDELIENQKELQNRFEVRRLEFGEID